MKRTIPHTKTIILLVSFVIILSISLLYTYRYKAYYAVGTTAFGGKVLGMSVYNIALAEKFFTMAKEEVPEAIWVNYQLSRINFIKGDLQRAIYFADRELELYPDNCRTHYIRGLTYGYMEHLDEAITDFETFNQCFPDTWAGHNDLAWFWFRKGDMDKVIKVIESTISVGTNAASPWLQNTYGVALMNTGSYLRAENALRMADYLAQNMTEEDWGKAYPGNDPKIYEQGLESMRRSIKSNLDILEKKRKEDTVKAQPTIHRYY
jgi:tetratricopeptide (TPR) repeat protein